MREELGDQWIEIIDGQKHMVKANAEYAFHRYVMENLEKCTE